MKMQQPIDKNIDFFWSLIKSRDQSLILANKNIIKLEEQLQETLSTLQSTQEQLLETQSRLCQAKEEIEAMSSSKFWKIRRIWFKFKSLFVAQHDS